MVSSPLDFCYPSSIRPPRTLQLDMTSTHRIDQVDDDPELLETMIDEMQNSSHLYRPTNYWENYKSRFMAELNELGLHDFRRRKGSVLRSFGATDLRTKSRIENKLAKLVGSNGQASNWLQEITGTCSSMLAAPVLRRQLKRSYHNAAELGRSCGAPPLEEIQFSMIGNPEERIVVNGTTTTSRMLYYYMRIAFACKYLDFDRVSVMVELGSGSGKSIEIIRKCFPHLTILLFDIAPQLYVCEQYLKSVFPGQVVSYRENRQRSSLNDLESGKIYVFGAWHFPLLKHAQVDLFWNCASFQEMEPHVVANYLNIVDQCADSVYLMAKMDGKESANSPGEHGVLEPVTMEHYQEGLSNHTIVGLDDCRLPSGRPMMAGYKESVWKRGVSAT